MKKKRGIICIRFGLLLLAAAFFLTAYNIADGIRADRAAQSVVVKLEERIPKETENLLPLIAEREMPAMEVEEYRYIGIIEIPDLGLTLPVMEEWDYERLKISPCRYSGSVYQDNLVIAAHNYPQHFYQIKDLPAGTVLIFTDIEGREYRYEVQYLEILDAGQEEKMTERQKDDFWDLTLFTCTADGTQRYTLRCSYQ